MQGFCKQQVRTGAPSSLPLTSLATADTPNRSQHRCRGLREEEDDGIRPPPISPCDSMGLYITDLHFDEPDPNYYKNALLSGGWRPALVSEAMYC